MRPLTVGQCAERLGVSAGVVYSALLAGALSGYRLGRANKRGSWRVMPCDLEAWLESLKSVKPRPTPPASPKPKPEPLKHLKL